SHPQRQIQHLDARKEVMHAQSDHSKVRCLFGLPQEGTSLKEGIERTVAWVQKQELARKPRPPVEFDTVEVMENMPPSWVTDKMRKAEAKKVSGHALQQQLWGSRVRSARICSFLVVML